MENKYRFLAKIIIEAKSPLNIGSGNKGIKSDSLVLRDVNGLPFIPGTTIAGLLRHTLGKDEEKLMGSLVDPDLPLRCRGSVRVQDLQAGGCPAMFQLIHLNVLLRPS